MERHVPRCTPTRVIGHVVEALNQPIPIRSRLGFAERSGDGIAGRNQRVAIRPGAATQRRS